MIKAIITGIIAAMQIIVKVSSSLINSIEMPDTESVKAGLGIIGAFFCGRIFRKGGKRK